MSRPDVSSLPDAVAAAATIAALREGMTLDDLAVILGRTPAGLAVASIGWIEAEYDAGRLTAHGHAVACALLSAATMPPAKS
jgi:hypothetical protein